MAIARLPAQQILDFGPHCALTRTAFRVDGPLSFDDWQRCGQKLAEINAAVQWWIGDWLNYGERAYAGKYAQALEVMDWDYGLLRDYAYVAQNVSLSLRNDKLSWSIHRCVAPFDRVFQQKVLKLAARDGLTVSAVRALIRSLLHQSQLPAALPGEYGVICADPPWAYDNSGFSQSAANQYPVLDDDAICNLPQRDDFPRFASPSVLFLWATSPRLPAAHQVMAAWGFAYKACMVWVKNRAPGLGWWLETRHELLLIGVRGTWTPFEKIDSVIDAAVRRHSQKPDAAYEGIERMFPGVRRVEIFARAPRDGWDRWGDQA